METVDLVVVGGGLAGMVAAIAARERGRRVIVLEKGAEPGGAGNARIASGSFHLAWSPLHLEKSTLLTRIQRETNGEVDPDLAFLLASQSARAGQWLLDHGANFLTSPDQEEKGWWLQPAKINVAGHPDPQSGAHRLMTQLYEEFHRQRGVVELQTTAVDVQRNGTGYTVTAVGPGRTVRRYHTEAVCLSDGGYQANPELLTRYVGPQSPSMFLRASRASTGRGLLMGLALGARMVGGGRFYGHILHREAFTQPLWPYPTLDDLCLAGLVVDSGGVPPRQTYRTGVELANLLARSENPRDFWVLLPAEIYETVGQQAPRGAPTPVDTLTREGRQMLYRAPLRPLLETLQMPVSRVLDLVTERLPEASPALDWVAIPIVPGITFTMGGLAINADCAVVDIDGAPIPGLYAAGSACGGIHGGPGGGYIGGLATAAITGLKVGETV